MTAEIEIEKNCSETVESCKLDIKIECHIDGHKKNCFVYLDVSKLPVKLIQGLNPNHAEYFFVLRSSPIFIPLEYKILVIGMNLQAKWKTVDPDQDLNCFKKG